jgi:hypothetical protein
MPWTIRASERNDEMKKNKSEEPVIVAYPAEISKPKTFTDKEVKMMTFRHAYKSLDGSLKENWSNLVILRQGEDGYCDCRTTGSKGLEYPMSLWSGCLYVDQEMGSNYQKLAADLRSQSLA